MQRFQQKLRVISILTLLLPSLILLSQKKPLTHEVYEKWNSIPYKCISPNGKFVAFNLEDPGCNEMNTEGSDGCVRGGEEAVYKQTGGTGNFVALNQASLGWQGMTTLGSDVYACVDGGDIYKQTGGTGHFVALNQTSRDWLGMTTLGSDVYACVYGGDIV